MAQPSHDDLHLELILIQIAKDYFPPLVPADWHHPGDLELPLPAYVTQLLHNGIAVMIADKQNHTPDTLAAALQECARLFGHLYSYLVTELYSTQSGKSLEANYYPADRFLVMVFNGEVAPVVEVIGQEIVPFVIEHHRQPAPAYRDLVGLADQVMESLFADPQQTLREGIIERVEPMLAMRLRPLPLHRPDPAAPEPPPAMPEEEPHVEPPPPPPQADLAAPRVGPPPPVQQQEPDPPPANPGAKPRKLRAPLPYWDIKRRRDDDK